MRRDCVQFCGKRVMKVRTFTLMTACRDRHQATVLDAFLTEYGISSVPLFCNSSLIWASVSPPALWVPHESPCQLPPAYTEQGLAQD